MIRAKGILINTNCEIEYYNWKFEVLLTFLSINSGIIYIFIGYI